MTYPRKLLNPGEEVVLDLRQHWIALTVAVLWTAVIVVALVALLWVSGSWPGWARTGLVVVAVIAFCVLAGWRFLTWAMRHFVLTTERVISRSGVFAKRAIDIPLDTINDIHFSQSIIERICGSGNLVISSASEFGNNEFRFIRDPEKVQNLIYHQREEAERVERREAARFQAEAMASFVQQPVQPNPTTDVPAQIAQLAQLRDQGAITDAEFQQKKAELLGRM
ncbi:MAG: PH domain-containing protein [Acidimicrobiia bacterium]|nr:PH domain-containing protein [Acidimicrobiia bacterium]